MAELGALEAMAVQGAQEAMAVQGAQEAMVVQGAQEAMVDGLSSTPAGTLLPPKNNFPGEVRGYQEPSGARQTGQYMTRQENPPGPDKQDIPQEPEALLGWLGSWGFLWAWRGVRGPYRVPQQPLPYQRQGGWNGLRGHKTRSRLPQTSLQGQDRQDLIKMFLWAQQDKHGSPGRDVWTGSTGLGLAAAGGHESVAIRRAWVSGGPVGIESAAARRALSQRRAGNQRTSRRAWDSHSRWRISPVIGGHEGSRPADSLAVTDKTQEQK